MAEDAQKALSVIGDYDGQKIRVSVAKKKLHDKKKAGELGTSTYITSLSWRRVCGEIS